MALILAGISHRGATVEVREKVALSIAEAREALEGIVARGDAREAVVLSTCNRTEFYLIEADSDAAPAVWSLLSGRLGEDASAYGYVMRDREAVAHLFAVTSGLDSMV